MTKSTTNFFDILYINSYLYYYDANSQIFQTFSINETNTNQTFKLINELPIESVNSTPLYVKLLKPPDQDNFYLIINEQLNIIQTIPFFSNANNEKNIYFNLRDAKNINSVLFLNNCFIFLIHNKYVDMYCISSINIVNITNITLSLCENQILDYLANSSIVYTQDQFNFTDIFVDNNHLYITDYNIGIIILNITYTYDPNLICIKLDEGVIYAKKINESLLIIRNSMQYDNVFEEYYIQMDSINQKFQISRNHSLNETNIKGIYISKDYAIIGQNNYSSFYRHSIPHSFNNTLSNLSLISNQNLIGFHSIDSIDDNVFLAIYLDRIELFRISIKNIIIYCLCPQEALSIYYLKIIFSSNDCPEKSSNNNYDFSLSFLFNNNNNNNEIDSNDFFYCNSSKNAVITIITVQEEKEEKKYHTDFIIGFSIGGFAFSLILLEICFHYCECEFQIASLDDGEFHCYIFMLFFHLLANIRNFISKKCKKRKNEHENKNKIGSTMEIGVIISESDKNITV